jgi:hypothetical protein
LSLIEKILKVLPGTHEGRARHYNGMMITWVDSERKVILSQPAHISKMQEDYQHLGDLTTTSARSLPVLPGLKFCKTGTSKGVDAELLDTATFPYRSLVGVLNYVSCCTRPDITFTVNQLTRYTNEPRVAHWNAAMECLRYLIHTKHLGIGLGMGGSIYKAWFRHGEPDVVAYADANHGTGIDDKKSISGMVLHVYGGHVSWSSKVQAVTSTSTTESEFRALSEVSREALWLAKIVKLYGIKEVPFLIRGDSQGAIQAIKNYSYTRHTKHIEIHHDFMRDRYQLSHLDFEYIPGKVNPADIFTKALPLHLFEQFRTMIGMCVVPKQASNKK